MIDLVDVGLAFDARDRAVHLDLGSETGPVDAGHHRAEALGVAVATRAQRVEVAPDLVGFGRGEHAVVRRPQAAVELDRRGDVARFAAVVVGRATDAAGVDQPVVGVERAERHVEVALVLGEERALVAEEGLDRAEVHDELVALDLAEVRIERTAELELAVGLPEDVARRHRSRSRRRRCRTRPTRTA